MHREVWNEKVRRRHRQRERAAWTKGAAVRQRETDDSGIQLGRTWEVGTRGVVYARALAGTLQATPFTSGYQTLVRSTRSYCCTLDALTNNTMRIMHTYASRRPTYTAVSEDSQLAPVTEQGNPQ